MKGIQRYFALALLLSVIASQAVAMEENLSSELQEAVVGSSDSVTRVTEVSSEDVKNVVSQVVECAADQKTLFSSIAEDLSSDLNRYERVKAWGQKFGTGLSASAARAKESFSKENMSKLAEQAKAFASSKKDAIAQYPYKAAANGLLEYAKGQAVANKAVIAGLGVAAAYETGLPSLAVKFAAKGVKSGAQKTYSAAKNHKKIATGLGATAVTGLAGLGYYFKDGLVQAAQSGAQYVQPMLTSALENKSDFGKAAGAALVGVAAIETYKGVRAIYKHLQQEPVLGQYEVNKDELTPEALFNGVLTCIENLVAEDVEFALQGGKPYQASKFFNFSRSRYSNLLTEEQWATIAKLQTAFNENYNKTFCPETRREAIIDMSTKQEEITQIFASMRK